VGHVISRWWGGNKMEDVSFHHFYFIYMASMIDDKVTWKSNWRTPKSLVKPTWGSNYVELWKVGTWGALPTSSTKRGVEGRVRSPGIRLGRGTRLSSLNLHPKPTTRGLVSIREHPWVLGQTTGTLTHKTHHGPDSGEATTFPHVVYSVVLRGGYIKWLFFPRLPSWSLETVPGWSLETLDAHSSSPQTRIGTRFKPKL